eukprot:438183_1
MAKEDYDKSLWAVEVYIRDPTHVCLGECLFAFVIPYIPKWITPNSMSYGCLFFSILLLLSSLLISLTNDNNIYMAYLCFVCSFSNTMTLSLDAIDGMHARATNQCSELGALLDWWIDSLGTPMNACAVALCTNTSNIIIAIGNGCAVLMFTEQLLLKYYKDKLERIIGVEGQVAASILFSILGIIYYYNLHKDSIVGMYIHYTFGILPGIGAAYSCFEFLYRFHKEYTEQMWSQWYISALSMLIINILFVIDFINMLEYSLLFCTISQYFNGGIVGYLVTKTKLPQFQYYFIHGGILIFLENVLCLLLWENVHTTAYVVFVFMLFQNMNDFIIFYNNTVQKDRQKKKKIK